MDWYDTLVEVIDMRSFSNLWYWIGLAVLWSTVSHWVIGVPFDMVQRARRYGGQAEIDLHDLVRINVNRLALINRISGIWLLVFGSAALTGLGIMGFWYGVEFTQALFLLAFPLGIVAIMSFRAASKIRNSGLQGEPLMQALTRHRFWTQMVGVAALVLTAFWGMYQNLAIGALRGF